MIRIREHLPGQLNADPMRMEMLNELRKVGREIKKDFEKTTKTWKTRPEFTIQIGLTRRKEEASVTVGTDNLIYKFISEGTGQNAGKGPRYPIWAGAYTGKTKATRLVFPRFHKPKTIPRSLNSVSGGKYGPLVFTPMVMHPGVKPREFDETVRDKWRDEFPRRLGEALRRGALKARHVKSGR